MRIILTISVIVFTVTTSSAQMAVWDATNWWENMMTNFNTAATLTEAIEIAKNTLETMNLTEEIASDTANNLASLGSVILNSGTYSAELEALWEETEALIWSMQRLSNNFSRLFDTDTLPLTSAMYAARRAEVFAYRYEAADHARKVQQLIRSFWHTMNRLVSWLDSIRVIIGGKQALLTQLQVQLETVSTLKQNETRQAALDHMQTVKELDTLTAAESRRRINQKVWSSWGKQ